MEGQTIQWPNEKRQTGKHYTENPLTGRHKPNWKPRVNSSAREGLAQREQG